jgi:5'-deoxynucleotidase YfbR-like HD superfamily hydrolase
MSIYETYRSGHVQRFHGNPDMAWTGQTLGHHQWGVAMLLCALFPERVNAAVLWEALHHDTGEMHTCDMSYPAKMRYPEAAAALAEAEGDARVWMGVPEVVLTEEEEAMLKLCDRLESLLFAKVRTPWVLHGDGWPEMRVQTINMGWSVGVGAEVEGLLREAGI